jgi:DNA-binding NtrC family response regulator
MTTHYTTESAVEAIQRGARDYLSKPIAPHQLRRCIENLLAEHAERTFAGQLDRSLLDSFQFEGIIGRSPVMLDLFAKMRRIAPHFRTVLISGETGTGKELVAGALHRLSPVHSGPMAMCNCAALVEPLLESELFGYVRGAFTGANYDKIGLFEYANGGTVFLDEIGELPLSAQSRLLRVLQNQEVQRVGSPDVRKVDVRIIAATNRDLRILMQEGRFRDDLYYRLGTVNISVPRLYDRREDLPLLQRFFVEKFSKEYNKQIRGITRRAQVLMAAYSWPGNVRELENSISLATMMTDRAIIDVLDLPPGMQLRSGGPSEGLVSFEELHRRHLQRVMEHVRGDKAMAAEILGISRSTLYNLLSKNKGTEHVNQGETCKSSS